MNDITAEAMVEKLAQNPRGLLAWRDELAGLFAGFDRYSAKGGGDVAFWLSTHGAGSVMSDRKGAGKSSYVARAAVSVTGGIQPTTLRDQLGPKNMANGLAARFLLSMPPIKAKRWTENSIDEHLVHRMERLFDALNRLDGRTDEDGRPAPVDLELSPEAKAAWVAWYDRHAQVQSELTGDLAAAWSKLEGYGARLSLLVHLISEAGGDGTHEFTGEFEVSSLSPPIEERSVEAGTALADWFGGEVRRVYGALEETAEERDQRKLIEFITTKGGSISSRDLQRSLRQYRSSIDLAECALESLVNNKIGNWSSLSSDSKGGRPSRVFTLSTTGDGDGTHKTPVNSQVVSPGFGGNGVTT